MANANNAPEAENDRAPLLGFEDPWVLVLDAAEAAEALVAVAALKSMVVAPPLAGSK